MPLVVPAVASTGPAPFVTIMLVLGAVLALVCLVVHPRVPHLTRPDDRRRSRHRARAEGSIAVLGGFGAGHTSGGFGSGRGGFEGGFFDGGSGGQC